MIVVIIMMTVFYECQSKPQTLEQMTYHILILVSVMVLANVVSCLLPSVDHDDILDDLGNLNFLDNLDFSQLHVDQVGDDDVVIAVFVVVLSVVLSISTIETSRCPD